MIKKDIKDFVLKTMHKVNGIVFEISDINPNMINLVISKKKRNICFVAYGDMAKKIKENFPLKSRIKIRFYATSKKWKDKWYTTLAIYEVFEWKKNEKKLAIQQAQLKFEEEVEYYRRPPKFDWRGELEKLNDATNNKQNDKSY